MERVILCQVLGYTLHILCILYHLITSSKVGLITASHRGGSQGSEILSTWPKPHSWDASKADLEARSMAQALPTPAPP